MDKKFCIKTLGCKVNQYESQVIREGFLKSGCIEASDMDSADIYIINTCTVTSASDAECFSLIHRAIRKKKARVIVTGCLAEDKYLDLLKLKDVDFIIKNKDKYRIPDIIIGRNQRTENRNQKIDDRYGISGFKGHTRVFIKVQDGCDNVCSYCKVRVVRGRSRSRPLKEIIDEADMLIRNGFKEIILTGICLGDYGKDVPKGLRLPALIKELCKIDGKWRLRLSSIEPKDVADELIKEIVSNDKLCKHLHIPFQSGDNDILKKMNRPYKASDYVNIVNRLKNRVPDIAISTDIMIGFPGETEKRFQNTVDFIEEIKPMRMHIFPFSKRKGTIAYNYKDNIDSITKKERGSKLFALEARLSQEFVAMFSGKEVEVLIEEKRDKDGYLKGYTDRYIKVFLNGSDDLKAKLITCPLTLTNQKVYGILPSSLD